MKLYSVEDFHGKIDSLYRLVIVAARRASQLNRTESRPLVSARSRKATVMAMEEILDGKVTYKTGPQDAEDFLE